MTQQIIATISLMGAVTASIGIIIRCHARNNISAGTVLACGISWAGFLAAMWIF